MTHTLQLLTLAGLSLAGLALVASMGWLSPRAFEKAPPRVRLQAFDVFLAVGLWMMGGAAVMQWVRTQIPPDPVLETVKGVGAAVRPVMSSPAVAWGQLAAVVLGQLPVVLYFIARSCLVTGGIKGVMTAGILPRRPWSEMGYAVAVGVIGIVWMWSVGVLIQLIITLSGGQPQEIAHGLLVQLVAADQLQIKIAIALSAVVAAPIIEEFIFRGLIQSAIRGGLLSMKQATLAEGQTISAATQSRFSWLAILVSGLLFGVVHAGAASLHALPLLALFGLVLGWLYERTGSLWPSILVHAAFNALNIAAVLAMG